MAFDLEMTGIKGETEYKDDFPFERYLKMKKVASKYNIIQTGFTFFVEKEDKSLVAYPFNFYTCPKSNPINNPDIGI